MLNGSHYSRINPKMQELPVFPLPLPESTSYTVAHCPFAHFTTIRSALVFVANNSCTTAFIILVIKGQCFLARYSHFPRLCRPLGWPCGGTVWRQVGAEPGRVTCSLESGAVVRRSRRAGGGRRRSVGRPPIINTSVRLCRGSVQRCLSSECSALAHSARPRATGRAVTQFI